MTGLSLTDRAVNLLAKRDHSRAELARKLQGAAYSAEDIEAMLDQLAESGLQNDDRFASNYIDYRSQRGFGNQRIAQELKQRGVNTDAINDALEQADVDWFQLATDVRKKRFGIAIPSDPKQRAKQQRFLLYRGFTHEQINQSFIDDEN